MIAHRLRIFFGALAAAVIATSMASAQQIILDRPIRAGDLTLFPSVGDANIYYYVTDKPRLATGTDGTPQFSFLRYVKNVPAAGGNSTASEGQSGGIVHAVVVLEVTQDQLREAERALRRLRPAGRIEGPVIYKSGQFGLVSSFREADGKYTDKVVGTGRAPILDGQKAAISIRLTGEGANILWQSFNTTTPDITFSFEMELEGYRAPKRAHLVANFDQMYSHDDFRAGIATEFIAAEINATFDDLRRTGAIRLEQVGADEDLESLIQTAYTKLTDMMFNQNGGTGGADVIANAAAAANTQTSMLDRATAMLTAARTDARQQNDQIRTRNEARQRERERTAAARPAATDAAALPAEEPHDASEGPASSGAAARRGVSGPTDPEGAARSASAATGGASGSSSSTQDEETASEPTLAIVASYTMKRVHQSGTFDIDLNKFTADTVTLRFDENIGDLRRHLANETIFRRVNLDDPFLRQREIAAYLDGANAADFGSFINFVTVDLRKKHQSGETTLEGVRIDKANFNQSANDFRMIYGWKGDDNRDDWLDYEYKANWSFFGGIQVAEDWKETDVSAIPLTAPYQKQTISLDADPETIRAAGVRLVTVRLYYTVAGTERMERIELQTGKDEFSKSIDLVMPRGEFAYDYDIEWRLRNGAKTKARSTSNASTLFVDEIPE